VPEMLCNVCKAEMEMDDDEIVAGECLLCGSTDIQEVA